MKIGIMYKLLYNDCCSLQVAIVHAGQIQFQASSSFDTTPNAQQCKHKSISHHLP